VDIKIVGAVCDENALEEIEDIAKVFAYEQRMKDYTPSLRIRRLPKKIVASPIKKIEDGTRFLSNIEPHILVKGLC
jgi:hypothetical protein